MAKSKVITEESETKRLKALYKNAPPGKMKTIEGLIIEAARLRVRLNNLWEDIQTKGEYELFKQGADNPTYERERPASKIYTATNKQYLSIIAKLTDLLPDEPENNEELEKYI